MVLADQVGISRGMGRPTIFISAYRNFTIRYLLYSKVFESLTKRNIKLVVFVKDEDVEHYRQKLDSPNVTVEPILYDSAMKAIRGSTLARFFVLVRKCISGSAGSQRNTTDRIRLYMYRQELCTSRRGMVVYTILGIVVWLSNKLRWFRKFLVDVECRLYDGKLYDEYLDRYRPNILVVSSLGYMIDPLFMRAAKRKGVKVVSIVHSWDNPTTKDYRGCEPDIVIAWNDIMKREVNIFHDIPEERIEIGGIAHWDFYFDGSFKPKNKELFLREYGLSPNKKILYYGTSSYKLFRNTFDVIEILLGKIKEGALTQPCQLIVRLHPTYYMLKAEGGDLACEHQRRQRALEEKYKGWVAFDEPKIAALNGDVDLSVTDMYRQAEIMYHADILLTEYSTLMIEAAIMDTPVINVGLFNFRDTDKPARVIEEYAHIRRILKVGATKNAYDELQLISYINAYLDDPSLLKRERQLLVEQEVTANRGSAGIEVARIMAEAHC